MLLQRYVADADLLRKLRGDCIKSMDDAPLKSVAALLESFATQLREYFPVLHSAVGTLSVNISLTGITVYLFVSYTRAADTHTHICLTALFPGLPGSASTRKVKPIWILLKQETVSGSGISWAICKSASRSRHNHASTPPLRFSTGRMPFLPPNQRQSTEGSRAADS